MVNQNTSLHQATQLITSSKENTTSTTTKQREIVDKLLLRLIGSYPGSRFAYALQDEKTYALTRYEWQDTLKDFNFEDAIIMEAMRDVKKIYADVPTISQFIEIAQRKVKLAREEALMAEKRRSLEANQFHRTEHQSDAAKRALKEIRNLCQIKKEVN